jgi:hypothetical protein
MNPSKGEWVRPETAPGGLDTAALEPPAYIGCMSPPSRFRRTLLQVMTMQVVALAVLWLLQSRYAG